MIAFASGQVCIKLSDGSRLYGQISDIRGGKIILKNELFGEISIPEKDATILTTGC